MYIQAAGELKSQDKKWSKSSRKTDSKSSLDESTRNDLADQTDFKVFH
jgi:hypothetical protein